MLKYGACSASVDYCVHIWMKNVKFFNSFVQILHIFSILCLLHTSIFYVFLNLPIFFFCLFIRRACQFPLPWLWSSLFFFNLLLPILALCICSSIIHCYTFPVLPKVSLLCTPLQFCQSLLLYNFKIMKKTVKGISII